MAFVSNNSLRKLVDLPVIDTYKWPSLFAFSIQKIVIIGVLGLAIVFLTVNDLVESRTKILINLVLWPLTLLMFGELIIEKNDKILMIHDAFKNYSQVSLFCLLLPLLSLSFTSDITHQQIFLFSSTTLVYFSSIPKSSQLKIEANPHFPPMNAFTILFLALVASIQIYFFENTWLIDFVNLSLSFIPFFVLAFSLTVPVQHLSSLQVPLIQIFPYLLLSLNLFLLPMTTLFHSYKLLTLLTHTLITWQLCFKLKVLLSCKSSLNKSNFVEVLMESAIILQEFTSKVLPQLPTFAIYVLFMTIRSFTFVAGTLKNIRMIKKVR